MTGRRIGIVGAGPAGFYTADMLSKARADVAVDLIERLPFPFGLVRYGVAPDHPGTRQVSQLFARVMRRPNLRFFGGVTLGEQVSVEDLRARYDALVIATGAAAGRKADIAGADLATSITGYDLARWLNGHPDLTGWALPARAASVAIIGNGNVALDIARLMAKGPEELAAADAAGPALDWLAGLGVEEIHVCGRRGPGDTRFTPSELAELDRLQRFAPWTARADFEATGANPAAAAVLERHGDADLAGRRPIRFHFHVSPLHYDGTVLRFTDLRSGAGREVRADLLVHAVGQLAQPPAGLPVDPVTGGVANQDGAVAGMGGVFVLGWANRPGDGLIAGNRQNAQVLADRLLAWLDAQPASAAGGIDDRLERLRPVSWDDWLRLDGLEQEEGRRQGRPRARFTDLRAVDEALRG